MADVGGASDRRDIGGFTRLVAQRVMHERAIQGAGRVVAELTAELRRVAVGKHPYRADVLFQRC